LVNENIHEEQEHEYSLEQVFDEQGHENNVQEGEDGEQDYYEQEHNIDGVPVTSEPMIDEMEQDMLNLLGTDASLLNLEVGAATAPVSESENTASYDTAVAEGAVHDSINEISELSGQIEMEKETCKRSKQKSYVNIKMENDEVFDALIMSYQPKKYLQGLDKHSGIGRM
jgi:hypothetical protein